MKFDRDNGSGTGFYTYGKGSTTKINGRHKWSLDFSPSVEPGRYILRAKYPARMGTSPP